ncbi:MAG: DUF4058 family protein [Planctomycetes bacterium]|nr:DUF4058 family protein [Planctomycetota bacterium]
MPIHDWSRVGPGVFHHFHYFWVARMCEALQLGLLPRGFHAMVEPVAGEAVPDVLTLQAQGTAIEEASESPQLSRDDDPGATVALATQPVVIQDLGPDYTKLQRQIVVRSEWDGDRVVAVIELVSPGNKESRTKVTQLLDKALGYLELGVHLLVIDVLKPTNLVPNGFHGLICEALGHQPPALSPGMDRQVVSYQVRESGYPRAHLVQVRLGDSLSEMPLYLLPRRFLRLPLERTYGDAFLLMAEKYREILER